ncbi:MAG: TonB-dependent receptor [Bacteroidales bacterium]|jgi:outer membrane receptor for ferrienterochelin and colicin|nr:TonB-dependent receptor [Bacteroidales bacterium]
MKTIKSLLIISLLALMTSAFAQNVIEGTVYEEVDGKRQPLPGVNVYWKIANVGTVTDEQGHYSLEIHPTYKCLVFSFVGYLNDTVHHMAKPQHYDHVMSTPVTLSEVEIAARQKAQYVSALDPRHIEHITSEALRRCACCSLAESFETNASVDVAYADAVTGAKQIELLGLSGLYTQMMTENMPNFRGLASAFGLGYVPGTWMHGISVSKGTSSVRNGYESISGQINVEFKEPDEEHSEKVFVNLFTNTMLMSELNFNTRVKVGKNDGLMLLGHVGFNPMKMDGNGDSFLDDPVTKQYSAFLRYNHPNTGHFGCKLGVKALKEERLSGQMDFDPKRRLEEGYDLYGIGINTERYEAFAKTGFIFDRPETSLGIQQQLTYHKMNSYFGLKDYNANQLSYYANLLFDSYIVTTNHKFSVGASFSYDRFNEKFIDSTMNRVERVGGAFAEYVFSDDHHWTVIGGFRADYNSYYQRMLYTPRLHVRFRTDNELALRLSAGKGYRSPNVLAENSTILASSRQIVFVNAPKMEEAWNFGINLSKHFDVGEKEIQLLVDAYRTDFLNQIVIDRDADAHQILIYNLDGKSYSNCAQIQVDYELFRDFDISLAFRYTDVKMTINDTLREKPFVNRYKGLVTLSYAPGTWQFDLITQFNGDSRIPDMSGNATAVKDGQVLERSPFYVIMNAQVTKKLGKHWEIYAGGENLTNFKQQRPIVAAYDPFSNDFDASMVWGPLSGIRGYLGVRFQVK